MVQRSGWWAVLVGGLAGGTLDILFAISFAAYNGMAAERLLQVVASGALGQAAFSGGHATAAIGLLCHFLISYLCWFGMVTLKSITVWCLPKLIRRCSVIGQAMVLMK